MIMSKEMGLIQRYFLMFGFGCIFMMCLVVQNIFLSNWQILIMVVIELFIIYFIVKKFVKQQLEMEEYK